MASKSKGAIFRMEEIDGKLYRVMYFKTDKGGFVRSKFIREVNKKQKKSGTRGRPKKIIQKKPINQQQVPQQKLPQNQVPQSSRFSQANGYVSRSGNTQEIINKWVELSKRK